MERRKKLKNHTNLAVRFHLPTFVTLTAVTLIPLLYALRLSFYDFKLSQAGSEDHFIGLKNYVQLFHDGEIGRASCRERV